MSHSDPSAGGFRDWERRDEPIGWAPPDSGDDIRVRARHTGAAPDAYPRNESPYPYGDGRPVGYGGHLGYDYVHREEFARYPGEGDYPYRGGGEEPDLHDPDAYPDVHPDVDADAGVDAAELETAAWPVVESPPSRRHYRGRRRAGRRRATRKAAGSGRAGRNLPAAIAVGVALAAGILVPLFLLPSAFFAVIAIAVGVGVWEMVRAVETRGVNPPLAPLLAGGLLMTGLAWRSGLDGLMLGLLVTALVVLVWRFADGPEGYQRDVAAGALIAVYVPFLAGFAALLVQPSDGPLRVLVTLAAVVLSDTGGYAVGVFFGRHPMAPSVSPKKSWEGFAGSVGSAALGSAVLLSVLLDTDLWLGALFGVSVSVAAVLGDLCESMIKRDLGVKDMSQLLPGHGGLMDRLDSILFAVPTAYLLLAIIVPMG